MRTLLFQNNVHSTKKVEIPGHEPAAVNLTVRKGLKWSDLAVGEAVLLRETPSTELTIDTEVVNHATIYDVKVMSFADLMNYKRLLKLEHDPKCQTYTGLFETMRRVYDGFLQHELVTLVMYELIVPRCNECGEAECECPNRSLPVDPPRPIDGIKECG